MAKTIREMYFKDMTLDQIKELNPFAAKDYLKDEVDPSPRRIQAIENLFDGEDTVSAEKIRAINGKKRTVNGKTGYNFGRYAAFRAVLHGIAKHDGNGGLVRIAEIGNLATDSPIGADSFGSHYLPTKEDCETAIRQLYNENVQARTEQVLDRIEKNVTFRGMALKPNWRMITEENMKKWSSYMLR